MKNIGLFNRVDHLMIEVDDPQSAYELFEKEFALPQAWPLTSSERYTSIGINFGNANIELISFKERFGERDTAYSGLSGVCLTSDIDSKNMREKLGGEDIDLLEGEDAPGHQTHVIASKAAPTLFVCHYKFNTAGWLTRLTEEFRSSNGGTHKVIGIAEVCINHPLLKTAVFDFSQPDSARLHYAQASEVRLRSANERLAGNTVVIGQTTFSFC